MTDHEVMIKIGAVIGTSFGAAFSKATQGIKGLSTATELAAKTQRRIQSALNATDVAFNDGAISAAKYQSKMKSLTDQLQRVSKAQKAIGKLGDAGTAMGQAKSSMVAHGKELVAKGAVAYGMLSEPIQQAVQFESAMADVRKVVDFDTPQQFQQMSKDVLNLSKEIPMTATDISKLVAAAGQAGIEKDGLLAFAQSAGKMGVAFDITAEQAGDMMAKWRTAFGMGQEGVNELADKVNYLGNTTAASAPQIADVVTRIGPLGAIGGVASGEIAALGASMVGSGIQSEVAATGIKNLILGLTAGEGATKSQAAAFASLGLDATEMAQRMQTDAKGAILDVFKALKGLDKDKQSAVLSDLFGKESISAIAPLLSNLDALQENFDKVGNKANYAGSMEAEYQARSQTTENQLILTKNAINAVAINMGSLLLPTISAGAKMVAEWASGFAKWGEAHPILLQFITGLGTAIALFPALASAARFAASGFSIFWQGLKVIGNAMKVIWFLATANPIVLLIAGIAAAAFLIYQYWEPIKAYMSSVWDSIAAAMESFSTWCSGLLQSLSDTVSTFVQGVIDWFVGMWDSPAGALLGFIAGPVTGLLVMAAWVIDHWSEVSTFMSTMWDAGVEAVSGFAASVQSIIGEICQWAQSTWESLKETLSHPIDAVVNFIKGGDSDAAAAGGKAIASNAVGGIYAKGAFLTTFAEASPEAAIPIDGSRRASNLWIKTGQMMGLLGTSAPSDVPSDLRSISRGGGGTIHATFAPTIQITGQSDSGQLNTVLTDKMNDFKRMLEDLINEQRRLSYD